MAGEEPFIVDRGVVCRNLLADASSGWPLWALAAVGFVSVGAGCLVDVRWLVIGLMIWLAVAPCVAALIFFSRTLSAEMVGNLLPHTLERLPDGYVLRVWRRADAEDSEESEPEWVESAIIELSDSNIVDRKTSCEYEMLYYKNSGMKILYVPRFKK